MKYTFEANLYKGECYRCPMAQEREIGTICGIDDCFVTAIEDSSECPLKESNEVVWHLYSEEKPTHSGYYLVTLNMFGKIFVNVYPSNGSFDVPVIAWAELPKPYKE